MSAQNCDIFALQKLAATFPAPNWTGTKERVCMNTLGSILGCLTEEEAAQLCAFGVFEADGQDIYGTVALVDVAAFLREHGAWWFALRGQKQDQAVAADCAELGLRVTEPAHRGTRLRRRAVTSAVTSAAGGQRKRRPARR